MVGPPMANGKSCGSFAGIVTLSTMITVSGGGVWNVLTNVHTTLSPTASENGAPLV